MVSVNEATNWNLQTDSISKYKSIGAYINKLDSTKFKLILNFINCDKSTSKIQILNIYEVTRPSEILNYKDYLDNKRLLFHGTKVRNLIGILSRGLLMPNHVDDGMLGCGIYFSDSIHTSLKYCDEAGETMRNTRIVAICEVALGKCKEYLDYDTSVVKPPDGYQSVHGVKSESSQFTDDEYVIYDVNQQMIRYLVELRMDGDEVKELEIERKMNSNEIENDAESEAIKINEEQVEKLERCSEALEKTDYGLIASTNDGKQVPLKSVHVRGQLLDMICQVMIFQEYENDEDVPIEAKYVFPLDDGATVCAFEAFINDKHVTGVCKEKVEAHREYREAIAKGHGAYLMDQESAQVFKVNVGNLPPKCKCVIKITYVAELSVENEIIVFRLPSHVAKWQLDKLRGEEDQQSLMSKFTELMESVNGEGVLSKSSLLLSIVMPFEIRSIRSPTHKIKLKQTACHAVVELNNQRHKILNEPFLLIVNMSTVHVPRMIVEDSLDDHHHRACMVSFYPQFESEMIKEPCIILAIDCSNSMVSTKSHESAKLLSLLILRHLPSLCTFNVIIFGSDYVELFPYPLKRTDFNVKMAFDFIQNAKSNRGNTNLLSLLESYIHIDHQETVNFILVSDGHINESYLLISSLNEVNNQNNSTAVRLFTCAVGDAPDKHLLKQLSSLTSASDEVFDNKCKSKWKEKVNDLMDKVSQPSAISQVSVDWIRHKSDTEENTDESKKLQAPLNINGLFNGRRLVIYAFVDFDCQQVELKATVGGQEVSTVVYCPELLITKGSLIHKLTAKALIDDWQHGYLSTNDKIENELLKTKLKENIIEMSKMYNISSEYTSFIAIEERTSETKRGTRKVTYTISETPHILQLISNDPQASSIDILSYMSFEVKKDDDVDVGGGKDQLNKFIETTISSYHKKLETDEYSHSEEFYQFLVQIKEKVESEYEENEVIREKFMDLYSKELQNSNNFTCSTRGRGRGGARGRCRGRGLGKGGAIRHSKRLQNSPMSQKGYFMALDDGCLLNNLSPDIDNSLLLDTERVSEEIPLEELIIPSHSLNVLSPLTTSVANDPFTIDSTTTIPLAPPPPPLPQSILGGSKGREKGGAVRQSKRLKNTPISQKGYFMELDDRCLSNDLSMDIDDSLLLNNDLMSEEIPVEEIINSLDFPSSLTASTVDDPFTLDSATTIPRPPPPPQPIFNQVMSIKRPQRQRLQQQAKPQAMSMTQNNQALPQPKRKQAVLKKANQNKRKRTSKMKYSSSSSSSSSSSRRRRGSRSRGSSELFDDMPCIIDNQPINDDLDSDSSDNVNSIKLTDTEEEIKENTNDIENKNVFEINTESLKSCITMIDIDHYKLIEILNFHKKVNSKLFIYNFLFCFI